MVNILAQTDEVQESYNQLGLTKLEFCAYDGSVCAVRKKIGHIRIKLKLTPPN